MMVAEQSGRLLYILPPPLPPERDPKLSKTAHMSEVVQGDALMPVWWKTPPDAVAELGAYPVFEQGGFRHHLFLWAAVPPLLRAVATLWFYVSAGLRIHRQERVAAVMCWGTNWTGLAAVLLKWLTGAKLIAEIPGVPHQAFVIDRQRPGWTLYVKRWLGNRLLSFVVRRSDRVKLYYPEQLDHYPALKRVPASVFHEFVPVQALAGDTSDEKYILTLGFPWHRKGIDVLIKAFAAVADRIPGYRLRIVGHLEDRARAYLEQLKGDCTAITLEKPVRYAEALSLMRNCSIFVLASRSEGMGRVLLEAMAARKPIIASRVDGIPRYVRDGENGLLFESEDVTDLSNKIVRLVHDQDLREQLGARGFALVNSELDEAAYVRHFREMLAALRLPHPEQSPLESPVGSLR
jgi:glycosyltransferase involved in cell wall biosynthesis